jgi:hypothetical protein
MTAADDVQVGDRFGRIAVVSTDYIREKSGAARFLCRCDCGTERLFLFKGGFKAQSCGCLQREKAAAGKQRHGESRTRLNRIWRGIKQRCQNPKATDWEWYGARGITVCEEWQSYEPFRDWSLANGYADDLQLDREDNDGPYSPENCRWVTITQNNRNKRDTRWLGAWGERKSLPDWAEDPRCKVGRRTLETRIRLGWSPEDAMQAPLNSRPYGRSSNGRRRGRD